MSRASDSYALDRILALLDGEEWSADHCAPLCAILESTGRHVRTPDEWRPPLRPMSLETFRAGAEFVPWAKAPVEALQTYEDPRDPTPFGAIMYPGGLWLALLRSGEAGLTLDRSTYTGRLDELEPKLLEWGVKECDLTEPVAPEAPEAPERCGACGRDSLDCSKEPCAAARKDRGEEGTFPFVGASGLVRDLLDALGVLGIQSDLDMMEAEGDNLKQEAMGDSSRCQHEPHEAVDGYCDSCRAKPPRKWTVFERAWEVLNG